MPLLINIRRLEREELQLKGKLPVSELALDGLDELVHARKPLRYELTAQKAGDGCLVQGDLELTLDCECSRCLKAFEFRLALPDWTVHFPLEGEEKAIIKDDSVDLTPYIREDILLSFRNIRCVKRIARGCPIEQISHVRMAVPARRPERRHGPR